MSYIPNMNCPCHHCTRRHADCHPWCYDYFLYTVLLEAKRNLYKEYAADNGIYNKKSEGYVRCLQIHAKTKKERLTR